VDDLCLIKMGRAKQISFAFRTWGGRREGAGRKPRWERAGVVHVRRPVLARRFPVHVTWRMRKHVWNLRTRRCFKVLERAFWLGSNQPFGFRLVHYSVQGNHIHLLVEAEDRRALWLGLQGLGVRIARALNRTMKRQGSVLDDRYHSRILRTPTEVKHVRRYLLNNAHHHYGLLGPDPYASTAPLARPHTFLLRQLR